MDLVCYGDDMRMVIDIDMMELVNQNDDMRVGIDIDMMQFVNQLWYKDGRLLVSIQMRWFNQQQPKQADLTIKFLTKTPVALHNKSSNKIQKKHVKQKDFSDWLTSNERVKGYIALFLFNRLFGDFLWQKHKTIDFAI